MKATPNPIDTLGDIRSMMEKSSRFISLSGLSGVFAGIYALIGSALAYVYYKDQSLVQVFWETDGSTLFTVLWNKYSFAFINASSVLFLSITTGIWLTTRKAKKNGQKIWDRTAKRLLINLAIPLAAGGIFCLILLRHGLVVLIAPSTLLFYGLALFNASKYTLDDIRYLGFLEICLGLMAMWWVGLGLLFWAIGFGVLHIIYGLVMYFKYER